MSTQSVNSLLWHLSALAWSSFIERNLKNVITSRATFLQNWLRVNFYLGNKFLIKRLPQLLEGADPLLQKYLYGDLFQYTIKFWRYVRDIGPFLDLLDDEETRKVLIKFKFIANQTNTFHKIANHFKYISGPNASDFTAPLLEDKRRHILALYQCSFCLEQVLKSYPKLHKDALAVANLDPKDTVLQNAIYTKKPKKFYFFK